MKIKKVKRGFTLIEVIIALTVAAFGLAPLFISQSRLLEQIGNNFAAWHALVELKNFICTTEQAQAALPEPQKKITAERDGVTLSYESVKPADNSALKTIKNFELMKATAEWELFRPSTLTLVSGRSIKPVKKESEEKKSGEHQ